MTQQKNNTQNTSRLCALHVHNPFFVARVHEYVDEHLSQLSERKQFHYLTRLFFWTKEVTYRKRLEVLKSSYGVDMELLYTLAKTIQESVPDENKSGGRRYRKDAYRIHHKVYRYNTIFFKMLFLKTVYNDERYQVLYTMLDKEDVLETKRILCHDVKGCATLSTHAVNFLYHVDHFIQEEKKKYNSLLQSCIQEQLGFEKKETIEAQVYLVTHAIIGASHFYTQTIEHSEIYRTLLLNIESILENNFMDISLDMKFEFLVCCALLSYTSFMEEKIWEEANNSFSAHGNYIVDTQNSYASQRCNDSFSISEHRNTLAIIASITPSVV